MVAELDQWAAEGPLPLPGHQMPWFPGDDDQQGQGYVVPPPPVTPPIPEGAAGTGPTSSPGERDSFVTDVIKLLSRMPSASRQAVADALWAKIPAAYWESIYSAGATVVNSIPRSENWVLIQRAITSVPSGTTGTLQLDDVTLPVPAGLSVVSFGDDMAGIMVNRASTRQLTVLSSGPVALILTGRIAPTESALYP